MPNKTITINGRAYDAVTGLPISERVYDQVSRVTNSKSQSPKKETAKAETKPISAAELKPEPEPKAEPKKKTAIKRDAATAATQVHSQTQRSKTLLRRAAKKPAPAVKRPTTGRHMDMARSSKITKFAPHPVTTPVEPAPKAAPKPDKAPQVHPVAAKAIARATPSKATVVKPVTAKDVKNVEIAAAMAKPKAKPAKKKNNKLVGRLAIIVGSILALGLILFAIYHFIPSVSVGIASAQAGVKASYPEYVPDGYSLSHPVTFDDGEVTLKFKSNGNSDNSYTIKQTRSSWDSSAVLDNVVRAAAGENYITTKERGLTVYSYNNNAAWVNGGVLYVISSDNAPLSGEQIRHIATSL
jgi:hypothetical protein